MKRDPVERDYSFLGEWPVGLASDTTNLHACSNGHDFQTLYANTQLWFVCRRCGWNFKATDARKGKAE